jgi:hypothetical protein
MRHDSVARIHFAKLRDEIVNRHIDGARAPVEFSAPSTLAVNHDHLSAVAVLNGVETLTTKPDSGG